MNRHKHNVTAYFGNKVPKYNVEEGDHIRGNGVYHPTKGWRKLRKEAPKLPLLLLTTLSKFLTK